MGKYVTVSVKIPVELKEKMKKYGIKPSHVLRKAIEDCIREEEIKRLKEKIEEMKPTLGKIRIEDIVRSIREDRVSR
ncbi:MAG: CopG family transcriptional regulator [Nitrososphaeria archaeon]|nr:CopG family transcriptional regulator [Nitrososphaeria archaeon]